MSSLFFFKTKKYHFGFYKFFNQELAYTRIKKDFSQHKEHFCKLNSFELKRVPQNNFCSENTFIIKKSIPFFKIFDKN